MIIPDPTYTTMRKEVCHVILSIIYKQNNTYNHFSGIYLKYLQSLIDEGYIIKVKVNNAPDELCIVHGRITGVFVVTDLGEVFLNYKEL